MGKKKGLITAAGAVVLRGQGERREVLVVRRPAYKDWSLPKGKPKTDEDLPATAVREVYEETGVRIRVGRPVGSNRYEVDRRPKVVRWWIGTVEHERRRRPDREVEKAVWLPVDKALSKLTYPDEAAMLVLALGMEETSAVLVVRHGKAMLRKHWSGDDCRRPLSSRGRRQSRRMVGLLAAYGTRSLASSSSTRCMQTLLPYAKEADLSVEGIGLLSEEQAKGNGAQVQQLMGTLAEQARGLEGALAVCGHRPVLPDMREGLGVPDRPMLTGEVLAVHLSAEGVPLAVEYHKSTA